MASRLHSPRRLGEHVLTGGRTIRKGRSRSSTQTPRAQHESVPLLGFLDSILKFSKVLLRQESSLMRKDLFLDLDETVDPLEKPVVDVAKDPPLDETVIDDQTNEDWSASCDAIKMELNRLVMWKCDIAQRKLASALKQESPVYSVICESILSIGDIFKSLTNSQIIESSGDGNLRISYETLEKSIEYFRSQLSSISMGARPSANTRLQKSFLEGVPEVNVLKTLRSDINRLLHLVDTMAGVARTADVARESIGS